MDFQWIVFSLKKPTLIDSAPGGCLSLRITPKIKPGGLLIIDNANWYLPPPPNLRPVAPSFVSEVLGAAGSPVPHESGPVFASLTANWAPLWPSNAFK